MALVTVGALAAIMALVSAFGGNTMTAYGPDRGIFSEILCTGASIVVGETLRDIPSEPVD